MTGHYVQCPACERWITQMTTATLPFHYTADEKGDRIACSGTGVLGRACQPDEPMIEPWVGVEAWEVKNAFLVQRLREAINRSDYTEAVRLTITARNRVPVPSKSSPPGGLSPYKEWRAQGFYRDQVLRDEGMWDVAPLDDTTIGLLLYTARKP